MATIKEERMTTATTRQAESTGSAILMMAFELDEADWTLGFTTGAGQRARRRQIPVRDVERIEREIAAAKKRFGLAADVPVVSCYEAGREGFWLHRWLEAHEVRSLVVDSSSIEVKRRARRTKTDRVDLDGLLRLLARYLAGERDAWSVVHVPSVTAEDTRHVERELETVKQDRTRIVNRVRGLLATQGVRLPITATLPEKLAMVRLWNGEPLTDQGRPPTLEFPNVFGKSWSGREDLNLPCGPWLSSPQPRDSLRLCSCQARRERQRLGTRHAQHTTMNKP
jgi:transposase